MLPSLPMPGEAATPSTYSPADASDARHLMVPSAGSTAMITPW